MASTSTNKQPLMVDRPMHNVVDLRSSMVRTTSENAFVDIIGSNSAQLVVDCTKNDGAVIAETYALCRKKDASNSNNEKAYNVLLFLSVSNQFLTPQEGYWVGGFVAGGTFPLTDANGDLVYETDGNGDLILDADGNPIVSINPGAVEGEKVRMLSMPVLLNPVPGVGSEDDLEVVGTHFKGLYVPKGYALWAAVQAQDAFDQSTGSVTLDEALQAPLLGVQGGWY